MEPEEAVGLARSLLRKRIAEREDNFLRLAERSIFQYSRSPYLPLLARKRIAFTDLKSWVSKYGLEDALRTLEREGVYFTVDEFKGKVPVRRKGITFTCEEGMFDNPYLSFVYEVRSGATRSAGTRIRIDFDYLHQRSLYDAFLLDLHGCLTAPIANWFPVFPGAPGINSSLRFAHIGNPAQRWFSQVAEDQVRVNWEKRWGTKTIFAVHRFFGCPLAEPEYAGLNDGYRIAQWASQALSEHSNCVIYTFAASAVRVCIAAAEANINLTGAKFLVTGEPLTPHKKREIESTGAVAIPVYGISEAGVIAAGCNQAHPQSDHCHLYKDTTAIISHQQVVPNFDLCLDSYLFSSVLYESPKILLNVGMGDFGDLEVEGCNCGFPLPGGQAPSLDELRLHQGTVWRWNRAIDDPAQGGHLRIEMRALPAGPTTVIDMLANAAFLIGLSLWLAEQDPRWTYVLPFERADHNFYRAAQHGLSAQRPGRLGSGTRYGRFPLPSLSSSWCPRHGTDWLRQAWPRKRQKGCST